MATKKLPISLNDSEQEAIHRLAGLLGWSGVYGEEAKTLKFGITFTLGSVEAAEKVIPGLEGDELAAYFTMLKTQREKRKALEALATAQKAAEKYNPKKAESIPEITLI